MFGFSASLGRGLQVFIASDFEVVIQVVESNSAIW